MSLDFYIGEPDKILIHPRFDLRELINRAGGTPEKFYELLKNEMEPGSGSTMKITLPQLHGEIWQFVDKSLVGRQFWRWYAMCMHCRSHSNPYKQPKRWTMAWAVRHRCASPMFEFGRRQ